MSSSPAGWHHDSTGRHEYRYWDGTRWTDDVADSGVASRDPFVTHAATQQASTQAAVWSPPDSATAVSSRVSSERNDQDSHRIDALLDACMFGRIQGSAAELFSLMGARPASVSPERSIWTKFAAYVAVARSHGKQLTAVKMSQFSIFWHTDAFQQTDSTVQFYFGRASDDQLRAIRLGALECCKDLDPATVVIPAGAGGDTAAEIVLCETIELGLNRVRESSPSDSQSPSTAPGTYPGTPTPASDPKSQFPPVDLASARRVLRALIMGFASPTTREQREQLIFEFGGASGTPRTLEEVGDFVANPQKPYSNADMLCRPWYWTLAVARSASKAGDHELVGYCAYWTLHWQSWEVPRRQAYERTMWALDVVPRSVAHDLADLVEASMRHLAPDYVLFGDNSGSITAEWIQQNARKMM